MSGVAEAIMIPAASQTCILRKDAPSESFEVGRGVSPASKVEGS